MKKKILGVLLAVGIIAGVIAGCGNSNTTQPANKKSRLK